MDSALNPFESVNHIDKLFSWEEAAVAARVEGDLTKLHQKNERVKVAVYPSEREHRFGHSLVFSTKILSMHPRCVAVTQEFNTRPGEALAVSSVIENREHNDQGQYVCF